MPAAVVEIACPTNTGRQIYLVLDLDQGDRFVMHARRAQCLGQAIDRFRPERQVAGHTPGDAGQ